MSHKNKVIDRLSFVWLPIISSIVICFIAIVTSSWTVSAAVSDAKSERKVNRAIAEEIKDKNRSLHTIVIAHQKIVLEEIRSLREDLLVIKTKRAIEKGE